MKTTQIISNNTLSVLTTKKTFTRNSLLLGESSFLRDSTRVPLTFSSGLGTSADKSQKLSCEEGVSVEL